MEAILARVDESGLDIDRRPAPLADEALVEQAHTAAYLGALDRIGAAGGGYLDPDTYMTGESMAAARTACGGLLEGLRLVLAGETGAAFAVVRPPGHHALRARAMGFCLVNNVAVAVHAARRQGLVRIAIIDFDVHHGNGTQEAFYLDPDVLYASTHQSPFYPGTGAASERGQGPALGTTVNIPLPAGTSDAAFLNAYRDQVAPAIDSFQPELILVSAGYDAHERDPLAGLSISTDGYRVLAGLIREWADRWCGGRTVWTLEGGYDLAALSQSVLATLEVLRS